jgi:hypothetical protein
MIPNSTVVYRTVKTALERPRTGRGTPVDPGVFVFLGKSPDDTRQRSTS